MNLLFAASDVLLPDAAAAAGIGISITFAVLLVLIGLLYAFRAVFSLIGKKERSAAAQPAAPAAADDKAVVAAIVGAIAAYRDDPDTAVKVTKIEKKN